MPNAAPSWQYHNPVAISFGSGCVETLPRVLGGRTATLVTFPEAADLGLTARLERILGASLTTIIDRTQSNPDIDGLADLYRDFWSRPAQGDVLIAVGGGSVLDTAKSLMVRTGDGSFEALVDLLSTGKSFVPHRVKPLIAVPTTAGTGSEVTPWATIWHRAAGKKYSLHLAQTWPEAALVDPALTLSLPAGATLAAGLDALSHALESIWNVNANSVSDTHAVAAARMVLETLPDLMRDLGSAHLRGRMSLAALQAGLAFSNQDSARAFDFLRHDAAPRVAARNRLFVFLADGALACARRRRRARRGAGTHFRRRACRRACPAGGLSGSARCQHALRELRRVGRGCLPHGGSSIARRARQEFHRRRA